MPGCRPPCVSTFSGTARQKWNYVKNLYQSSYGIDENGDIVDPRSTGDQSYIDDHARYDEEYDDDHIIWLAYYSHIGFEKWIQWKYEYGTTYYGNLSQHHRNDHSGHCWMPCPYSTDSSDGRSETMWDLHDSPTLTKNDHGDNYMQTDSRGTVWGWTCTYSGCPYLIDTGGTVSGTRYFYV